MRNFRYIIRLFVAFISRFKFILLLAGFAGIVLFLMFKNVDSIQFLKKSETIGLVGKYRTDNLPIGLTSLIGDGLTKIDENGIVNPNLASSWETTDNGKTWTFHLRDNIFWQDSKKLVANNLIYNFSDAEVSYPDGKTIVFKLQNPFAAFPAIVAKPVFKKGLLGTGEWKVSKASLSGNFVQKLVLTAKNGDKRTYKFYPTEERAKLAFKLGSVQKLDGIFSVTPFNDWKNVGITKKINNYRYTAIFFNMKSGEFGDKEFRQALAYAIDKTKLPGTRAYSPISEDSWAYNPQVKPYNYDFKKASDSINALVKEKKQVFSVNLSTSAVLLPVAEQIAKDWEKVGVKTNVQVENTIPQDFQILLAIIDLPYDPDQYSIWHSTQTASNISHYQNQRIDKLLEDGRLELNSEKRKSIYLDFQRFLVEDSPAIFLYHPVNYLIERK